VIVDHEWFNPGDRCHTGEAPPNEESCCQRQVDEEVGEEGLIVLI
jgi:hypothetical protein